MMTTYGFFNKCIKTKKFKVVYVFDMNENLLLESGDYKKIADFVGCKETYIRQLAKYQRAKNGFILSYSKPLQIKIETFIK